MQGVIIINEVPENCGKCDLHNHCGMCLVNGGDCDYESDTRPESCPINTNEAIISFINLLKDGLKDGNIT